MKPRVTEKEFLRQVLQLARLHGWRYYHTFNSRKSVAGFPDVVLLRGDDMIVAELKTDTGRLTVEQGLWLAAFRRAGMDVRIWTPACWPEIEQTLRREP